MKKALFVLFFAVVVRSGARADNPSPETEAEYYYTRVIYTGVGTPERGGPVPLRYPPLRDFKCSDLERGEGGLGGGWRTDYPASDCKFIWGVERLTHEIFHTFFDIDTVMQIPNVGNGCYGRQTWESPTDTEPRIYGISDDKGRLMVIVTYNSDLGDAWEHMDVACYPEKYSGQAYRMGINFVIYAMTH